MPRPAPRRLAAGSVAGPKVRRSHAAPESRIHGDRGHLAGPGHRRELRYSRRATDDLLAKVPFPDGDRLVLVRTYPEWNPALSNSASIPDYIAWKQQSRSFESMGASIADHSRDFGAEEDGRPAERIEGHGFAPSLFVALGVQPLLGRTFTEEEAEIDHPAPVMVLSHRLWQRRFGGDPGVLGKQVRLSGANLTIIGVMPPDFQYPLEETEYWVPLGINRFQLQGIGTILCSGGAPETRRERPAGASGDGWDRRSARARFSRPPQRLADSRPNAARRLVRLDENAAGDAGRSGGAGSPDRVRECRRSAAGARRRPPPGNRHANGAGRRTRPCRAPDADRERPAVPDRRSAGNLRRLGSPEGAAADEPTAGRPADDRRCRGSSTPRITGPAFGGNRLDFRHGSGDRLLSVGSRGSS